MPRSKAKSEPVASPVTSSQPFYCDPKAEWGGFINIRLSDEHKAAFYDWLATNKNNVVPALEELAGAGMKIAFSYDAENEATVVTFTGNLVSGKPARWCVTTRAGSLAECLALACWKHYVLADQRYDDYLPKSDTLKRWG